MALKKVKDLFWKEGKPIQSNVVTPGIAFPKTIVTASASNQTGEVDSQFFKTIGEELEKAKSVALIEFFNQLSVITEKFSTLTEEMRYQLAFHAAETALKGRNQGLTKTDLIQAMPVLLKKLEEEKREFEVANQNEFLLKSKLSQDVAQQAKQEAEDRENKLQILQKEIETFLAAKDAEKNKLEEEKTKFNSEFEVKSKEIEALSQEKIIREQKFSIALNAHQQVIEEMSSKISSCVK